MHEINLEVPQRWALYRAMRAEDYAFGAGYDGEDFATRVMRRLDGMFTIEEEDAAFTDLHLWMFVTGEDLEQVVHRLQNAQWFLEKNPWTRTCLMARVNRDYAAIALAAR